MESTEHEIKELKAKTYDLMRERETLIVKVQALEKEINETAQTILKLEEG